MFNSRNIRGHTTVQNKENAVLGSVSRPGKPGLLGNKDSLAGGHPIKNISSPAVFGSPAANASTPRSKQPDGKQQQKTRFGLRDVTQTPSSTMRSQKPTALQSQTQAPRTIKRRQGLFSPSVQTKEIVTSTQHLSELLEPEYAPPKSVGSRINPIDEFGYDLDISLVPLTQLSTAGARAKTLPMPSLEPEQLIEIASPASLQKSHIPSFSSIVMLPMACRPALLVAHALHPTRIPRLKRKR
ncbi:hypothetical protein GGF48_002294 [Coemansia sp. RSA 921]|nr:hypothetical protein LPJ58_004535 [Coemansia sp. RSA 1591]KAJ2129770.1 hypothetical protein GGF48_002294 [Coemansia sp. RSA 921]KAJ2281164.1 hypothetical protein EV176_000621 [Coemansia sp. RSA 451]KAJ2439970.1 hypothetical protein IWW46_004201 [Coemansia sp. RSA 2440]KAJ2528821.1 hypothetical protein GGH20_002482 [Coemansia sp. RSA 1937]